MLSKEEKHFVDLIERLMVRWGYKHVEGRIYGFLLVSENSLSIADLVRLTGMSRTSISVSLSKLARDYLVTYTKNGKTKLFSPISSFMEKFMEQPKLLLDKEIIPAKDLLARMISKAEDQNYKVKLQRVEDSLNELISLLKEIIRFESHIRKEKEVTSI